MITPDDVALHAELIDAEGTGPVRGGRYFAYDDATGRELVPRATLAGKLSIGFGVNLTDTGLSRDEVEWLLTNRLTETIAAVRAALPWFDTLDAPRQRVLVNLAYNAGVGGLLTFKRMLSAVQAGNYLAAAAEIERSQLSLRRRDLLATTMRS